MSESDNHKMATRGHPVTSVKSSREARELSREALKVKVNAMMQLRQVIRTTPNRGAFAYTFINTFGKDLLLVLRYLPLGILNKVTPTHITSSSSNNSNDGKNNNTNTQDTCSPTSSSTVSTDNSSSNSMFTDFVGRATFVASSMKDKVLRNPKSLATADLVGSLPKVNFSDNSDNSKVILTTTTSSSLSTPPPPPALIVVEKEESIKEIAKSQQEDRVTSNTEWDSEMKHFLHDMTIEWKNIEARTRYLVSKLTSMVNDPNSPNLIHYIEDLYNHIEQYRESRVTAVESGAVKSLVRVLRTHPDNVCLVNCARETLGLLGINPPLKGHGIKVLSIDGGGVRGLVAIEVLRIIEKETGKRVHELFDYICGVSTGSILAFLIGAHRRTLDECEGLYKHLSREIFNQNSLIGAGSLFWSHSYYNTAAWEKILKKHIGEHDLMTQARDPDLPRVAAISTIVNHERVSPYVFRTYSFNPSHTRSHYSGSSRHKMWEAVRASAAAPTYFEEIKLGHTLHQDGGVLVNNPSSVALSEAKAIWQGQSIQAVISLGTGQTFSSRNDRNLSDLSFSNAATSKSPNSLSWKGKFLKVLDSATDTEHVHYTLMELLPKNVYFRFNPHLSSMMSMDETKPERLEQVQQETSEYLVRNIDKIKYCCEQLTAKKGISKKVYDWWNYQG